MFKYSVASNHALVTCQGKCPLTEFHSTISTCWLPQTTGRIVELIQESGSASFGLEKGIADV